jgi:hypothetical protein
MIHIRIIKIFIHLVAMFIFVYMIICLINFLLLVFLVFVLSYNPSYKGSCCLDPLTCQFYITQHVQFDENLFSFHRYILSSATLLASLS